MHQHSDIGIQLNLQDTYPSIGYMIQGASNPEPATTVWELWDSNVEGPGMNSRNHIMFGSVGSWFYKAFLGFYTTHQGPHSIIVGPDASVVNMLNTTTASGKSLTPYGTFQVAWHIESVPKLCSRTEEGETAGVSCHGAGVISNIVYSYYGTPTGSCSSGFSKGQCNSTNSLSRVQSACLGKPSCEIPASNTFFGGDPCFDTPKYLAILVTCSNGIPKSTYNIKVTFPVGVSAQVNIPVVSNIQQTLANLLVWEGTSVVWSKERFVGGTPGVIGGAVNPTKTGIILNVTSGVYSFTSIGS